MKCSVWKSTRKDYAYIYLAHGQDFEELPSALRKAFGEPELVMELELAPERKLAYEDTVEVMHNLSNVGYHLQLPPSDDPTGLLELNDREETLL